MTGADIDVLVILTDQQRFDTIAALGNEAIATPNLDALAADSLRFRQAFCPSPLCVPSRHSLLTGLYPHQHLGRANRLGLPPGLPTFPRLLGESGYDRAAVGKMHFTPTYADAGFARMRLAEQDGDGRFADDYHRELADAGLVDALDMIDQRAEYRVRAPEWYWRSFGAASSNLPERWHSTTWIAEAALRELDGWAGRGGHLLMAGFIKPHHPFDPPRAWLDRYSPDALPLPPGWLPEVPPRDRAFGPRYLPDENLTERRLRRITAHYYASISHLDHHIGRLIAALRARGRYDRTMIVFTSDHGEFLGFHHLLLKHNHPYDPVMRVPLLIKPPAGEATPADRDDLVSLVDIAPTIVARCGAGPPSHWPGHALLDAPAPREVVMAELAEGYYMVRSRRHKLIVAPPGRQNLLFDLTLDPDELTDRYPDDGYRTVREELTARLHRWMLHEAVAPPYRDDAAPCVPSHTGHTDHAVRVAAVRERLDRQVHRWLAGHDHPQEESS